MHHPTRTTAMLGANATMRMPKEPPTQPMTIHGRRMPSCDEVRSLILPKNGLPTMDSNAPMEATSAKLCGAWLIPTSAFTFNARVTSRGARNSRLVLVKASVYSARKLHPTGRVAADSNSRAASASGWPTGTACVMVSPYWPACRAGCRPHAADAENPALGVYSVRVKVTRDRLDVEPLCPDTP